MVNPQLSTSNTLRFITTTNFTGAVGVTYNNLLDAWFIAGTPTTGYQLFDYIKVRRVTVWGIAGNGANSTFANGAATVSVEFPGLVLGSFGGGKTVTDSTLGNARPACVSLRPDPGSQSAQWQASSNNTAFVVRASDYAGAALTGAIIDVECSWRNNPDVNPVTIASAIAGAVSGNLYYGGIDGARLAATQARSMFTPRL